MSSEHPGGPEEPASGSGSPAQPSTETRESQRPMHDLQRGARVHLFGHVARAAHPAMLAVTTNLFGPESWGLFVAAQAALAVASRTCLLGYDRALVYWLPREASAPVLSGTLLRVAIGVVALAALGASWAAGALATLKGVSPGPWTVMALALAPQTLVDLLAYASAGVRRMEVLVIVRDVVVQALFFVFAWGMYAMGVHETGLAWAFVAAQGVGASAALVWSLRLIPASAWGALQLAPLPRTFRIYAREMWVADLAISMQNRVDALVLASLAPPQVVGVYGIALQFGNTVRSLRGAFEPVVTAVASGLSSRADRRNLRENLTYATRMVLGFQLLPTALTVCLGPLVLPLFGEGFEAAYPAAVLLCVGWTLHGSVGLAGPVVMGFGKSRWTLVTAFGTLAVLLALLAVLVPALGAEGAALSVALAFTGQGLIQQLQARRLVGEALFTRKIYDTLRIALLSGLGAAATYFAALEVAGQRAAMVGSYVVFTAALLPSVLRTMRGQKPGSRSRPP